MVFEYCQGGDLFTLLCENNTQLGWKFRLKLALQAIAGVLHLHSMNILHRDIKSTVSYLPYSTIIPY